MARISGWALASAVTDAGGLGFLGGGYGNRDWIDQQMHQVDPHRVGVGLITWRLDETPEVLDHVLAWQPRAVWLSFGDPTPYVPRIKRAGAVAVCQVARLAEARAAVSAGADILVVQGSEAGGHGRAGRGLMSLLPAVVDAVDPIPTIGAGGIASGRQLAACWELGAAGVAVGTRLYATPEASDVEQAKQRLVEMSGDDTVQTTVFDAVRGPSWPLGYTGRAAVNATTRAWHGNEAALDEVLTSERARYLAADEANDVDRRVVWAGESVDLIDSIEPAGRVVRRLYDDARASSRPAGPDLRTRPARAPS